MLLILSGKTVISRATVLLIFIFILISRVCSQEEVGFRAGLHRTEIGQLERGHRLARIDTVVKLAGALSIAPGDLLAGMKWTPGGVARPGKFEAAHE